MLGLGLDHEIGNKETENGVVRISFTLNQQDGQSDESHEADKDRLVDFFSKMVYLSHFVFQRERGESQRSHYQGHVKLSKRKRIGQIAYEWSRIFPAMHVSPSSRAGNSSAEFYCMKEDGRIDGPWYDGNYIVPDYSTFTEPFGWQLPLWNMINGPPIERKIYWCWEPDGGMGKSTFTKYCGWKGKIQKLVLATADNILSLVIKSPDRRGYILDLPRTCEGSNMTSTFQAMEEIKGQYITSTKYEGGSRMLPIIPHIIIFSNYPPSTKDRTAFSIGRWTILKISQLGLIQEDGQVWYGDVSQCKKRKLD